MTVIFPSGATHADYCDGTCQRDPNVVLCPATWPPPNAVVIPAGQEYLAREILDVDLIERTMALLVYVSDHGGGERGPLATCPTPCASCDARILADLWIAKRTQHDCLKHYAYGEPSPWQCRSCGQRWQVRDSRWVRIPSG
jgi:hypothetical protein